MMVPGLATDIRGVLTSRSICRDRSIKLLRSSLRNAHQGSQCILHHFLARVREGGEEGGKREGEGGPLEGSQQGGSNLFAGQRGTKKGI